MMMNDDSGAVCSINEINPDAVAKVKAEELPKNQVEGLWRLFSAVADPTRIKLLHSLMVVEELCVCDLAAVTGLSVSAVSHQLRLLRDRYLVTARREGRMVYYSLSCPHVKDLMATGEAHVAEV
jgi:DNA-binding transcriptional ArsR family regulator